jgi:hypothetical protein
MIPPGGITHGSAAAKLGGVIWLLESLRKSHGIPLRRMYVDMPAIIPYAMLS